MLMRKSAFLVMILFLTTVFLNMPLMTAFSKEIVNPDFGGQTGSNDATATPEPGKATPTPAPHEPDDVMLKKAGLLSALGIMEGISDKAFKPDDKITRGEFAGIVLKMLNINPESMASGSTQGFYDVKASDSAYKSIMAIRALGISSGYNDNTYRPTQNITTAEALPMLVKAMGYDTVLSQSKDAGGYLAVAGRLGLISEMKLSPLSELTKEEAIRILYQCLDKPIMKQISFGSKNKYNNDKDITMLSEYHHVYKADGRVLSTDITSLTAQDAAKGKIIIDGNIFTVKDDAYNELIGYKVEYYYRDNQSIDDEIVYMSKHKNVEEIKIKADDVQSFNNSTLTFSQPKDGKTVHKKITLAHDVLLNGKHLSSYDKNLFFQKTGSITLVSNDGTDEYDFIKVDSFANLVASTISLKDNVIDINLSYNMKRIKIDLDRKGTVCEIVDSNGQKKTVNDLTALSNALLSIYSDSYETISGHIVPSDDATYIKIVINSQSVTGTYSQKGEDSIYIDDKEYKVSSLNYLNEDNNKAVIGSKGTFYLDEDAKIASWAKDGGNDYEYGYLIKAAKESTLEKVLQLKILKTTGEIKILNCTKNFTLNDKSEKNSDDAITALQASAKLIDDSVTGVSQLIKFKTNSSGAVTSVQTVLQAIGLPPNADKDHLRKEGARELLFKRWDNNNCLYRNDIFNTMLYSSPKIYFNVPLIETGDDDDYGVNAFWKSQDPKTVEVYDCSVVKQPNVCVVYESPKDVVIAGCVMVDKVVQTLDKDGSSISKILIVGYGAVTEYAGKNADTFKDIKKGDLLTLYGKNNIVSSYNMLLRVDDLKGRTILNTASPKSTADFKTSLGEAYANESIMILLQSGEVLQDSEGKRENQWVVNWFGTVLESAILYDATDSQTNPVIRTATFADIQSVYANGADKASIVFTAEANAQLYNIVVYNGIR